MLRIYGGGSVYFSGCLCMWLSYYNI